MIDSTHWVLDIETTMAHDKIRLLGMRNMRFPEIAITTPHPETFMAWIDEHVFAEGIAARQTIWSWNGARFDFPVMERIYPELDFQDAKLVDGMHLAQILDHACKRKSLGYWSERMKVGSKSHPDIDYDNCNILELTAYLHNDLNITCATINRMYREMIGKWEDTAKLEKTLMLEFKVARIVQEQVDKKVCFNVDYAKSIRSDIQTTMEGYREMVESELPTWPLSKSQLVNVPKNQFKKDGTPSIALQNMAIKLNMSIVHNATSGYSLMDHEGKGYSLPLTEPPITEAKLKVGQSAQIKDYLLSIGWEPTEWNSKYDSSVGKYVKTSPRLTNRDTKEPCPNLDKLGITWVQAYSHWLTARSRLNLLESDKGTGWIPLAIENGGCLPSEADTMGANTGRYTHKIIANIPSPSASYGIAMRRMFCARPAKVWVGWDASALEARVEAHYCYRFDQDYANELVKGDVHQRNLDLMPSLRTRDKAKMFKYAITYGAQPSKLASALGVSRLEAAEIFDDFWDKNTALKQVREFTKKEWELNDKKYITALDGRPIATRSEHSLINARFQSAGAIIMKYASIIANHKIRQAFSKEQAYGLIRYHDEEVWECDPYVADEVARIGRESVILAGQYLKLQVPLEAEAKIGESWYDVH